MNKSVVKKLVKAKLLEYDALKEVISERMPEPMREKAKQIESEAIDIAKEIALEAILERKTSADKDDPEEERAKETDIKSKTHHIDIHFGEES